MTSRTSERARFSPRRAGAASALLIALWASTSAAAPSGVVRLSHGDAAVTQPLRSLGLVEERSSFEGPVAGVRWDRAALLAACESLASDLDLAPPFEGDVDVQGDTAVPIPPEVGEAVDCPALALRIERSLAAGEEASIEVPVMAREPRTSAEALEELAREVDALLEGPVTLAVVFEGRTGGEVVLEPDDVRAALRVGVRGDPARPFAELRTDALEDELAPILGALGQPARDADFVIERGAPGRGEAGGDGGAVRVVPGRRGLRLDGAALFAAAEEAAKKGDKKGTVAATKGEPDLTTKQAESLQIKGLVASFTTKYSKGQPRVTNIHRITTLLDGAVVEPGERFSLNQRGGKRTAKRGFVLAPSIGEGEIVETVGGGVSQVATTLYNAVFDAGYAVVSRKPHTRYFDRYPIGVEATLSWPRPDFVFRNDSKAGVLIKASFTDDSVTVKLYGDNGGRKVTRVVSKSFDPTDPRVDYEPDDTLAIDKTKVKDAGTKGFSVKAGRDIVFPDGTKKHEERKVIYHGRPRVLVSHPCSIPKGEKGHKKKGCPKPTERAESDALYEDLTRAADKGEGKKGAEKAPEKGDKASGKKAATAGAKSGATSKTGAAAKAVAAGGAASKDRPKKK